MEVVKQSEFCGGGGEADKTMVLTDIPAGTIFRASIGRGCNPSNPRHVWVKTCAGTAICIGESDVNMPVGSRPCGNAHTAVRDYKPLDAVIVIKRE